MKLEAKTLGCDIRRLESYLNGELHDDDIQSVEGHLSGCADCRESIEQIVGSRDDWQKTQSLLSCDEYDREYVQPFERGAGLRHTDSKVLEPDADASSPHGEAAMLSREIDGWLDATDDPQALGRFAGYEILGIVGHGGMGIVLKGFEAALNRFVAIKVLAPRLATNGAARKRFAREAQAAAAVLHENVIAIHRVDEWHGLPFLVMPYVGGVSLQKRIDEEGPLSLEATLRIGLQIAAGLSAAHAQGLVHRDIKPANILLDNGVERVTITDFGLARAVDDASVTRTGVVAGTPQFMSPEQARAMTVDARSDLFSLGSVLYTMAAGRPPFRGDGSFEILKRIESERARSLCEIEPSIPDWFENLVGRLHAKLPDKRPQSAEEVQRLLNGCLLHLKQPGNPMPKELMPATAPKTTLAWRSMIAIGLTAFVLLWLFFQVSSQAPNEKQPGPQAAAGTDTKANGKVIGKVFGKEIHEGDINKNVDLSEDLRRLFVVPLEERFCKQQEGLEPGEEVKSRIKHEGLRAAAIPMIRRARLQKHLYEKYGGRVLLSAFGPLAFDASKKWLEERERLGEFEIAEPQHRAKLFELWTNEKKYGWRLTENRAQIEQAFDPAATQRLIDNLGSIPAGSHADPKMKLIGIVLGTPIHIHERYFKNDEELMEILRGVLVKRLEDHYRKQHPDVEPTSAEIEALERASKSNEDTIRRRYQQSLESVLTELTQVKPNSKRYEELQAEKRVIESKMSRIGGRAMAAFLAPIIKFQAHLHGKYGGGRALRTPQGANAFDAQKKWLEEREGLGEFQIADPQIRTKFYDYWTKAEGRLGGTLIDDPAQLKAWFQPGWLAAANLQRETDGENGELDARPDAKSAAKQAAKRFLAALLSADVDDSAGLSRQARDFKKALASDRLDVASIHVNDAANRALVVTTEAKLSEPEPDGRDSGYLVITLEKHDNNWGITDVDSETKVSAQEEVLRFLQDDAAEAAKTTGSRDPKQHVEYADLHEGRWYNFYFVKGRSPFPSSTARNERSRSSLTIFAAKVVSRKLPAEIQITFPKTSKDHIGILGARATDQKNTGAASVSGPAFKRWVESVSAWKTIWIDLKHVDRITPMQ